MGMEGCHPWIDQEQVLHITEDVLNLIANLLTDPADILPMLRACRSWYRFWNSRRIWKTVLQHKFPQHLISDDFHPREALHRLLRIQRNWRSGNYQHTRRRLSHPKSHTRILFCDVDHEMKFVFVLSTAGLSIYNLETFLLLKSFPKIIQAKSNAIKPCLPLSNG